MSEHIVHKTIRIRAPRDKVWEALTNPELTRKYFFGTRVHSDWKVGSPISFTGRLFFFWPIEMSGTITRIEPGRLLQYVLKNTGSRTTSTVTDSLHEENGITTLTIMDDVGTGEGAEKRYSRSVKGWDKILNGLKKLLED